MTAPSVQEKPTAAYVLSLIGGIVGLLVGFILAAIAASIAYGPFYSPSAFFVGIGVWSIISAVIVIISAVELNSNPWEHTKWGVIILVFSVIGLGTLLGLIGGILALVYKPEGPAPQQPPMPTITRICPKCGRVLDEEARFCPYCGNKLE